MNVFRQFDFKARIIGFVISGRRSRKVSFIIRRVMHLTYAILINLQPVTPRLSCEVLHVHPGLYKWGTLPRLSDPPRSGPHIRSSKWPSLQRSAW